uniref:(California timema) hypothetical protein n=1 Tax=Timema californicum TaxID=61474 RepID=A0A7R9P6J7_TIMCA|nr:unnamed protein product [Timema californicum]
MGHTHTHTHTHLGWAERQPGGLAEYRSRVLMKPASAVARSALSPPQTTSRVFGLIEPFVWARSLRAFRTSGLGLGEDSDPFLGQRGGGVRGGKGVGVPRSRNELRVLLATCCESEKNYKKRIPIT